MALFLSCMDRSKKQKSLLSITPEIRGSATQEEFHRSGATHGLTNPIVHQEESLFFKNGKSPIANKPFYFAMTEMSD